MFSDVVRSRYPALRLREHGPWVTRILKRGRLGGDDRTRQVAGQPGELGGAIFGPIWPRRTSDVL